MDEVDITQNDMIVSIDSSYLLDYDWSAKYISTQQLAVTVDVVSVLNGLETLTIKYTNVNKYRTKIGGCLLNYSYSITMTTNLQDSVDQAYVLSYFSQFFTYSGLLILGGVILALGGLLEMLWSLINTLKIISYLPLKTPYFPEYVRVMYGILELTNLDIMANLFRKLTTISNIDVGINNSRFTLNGIESSLFLNNAASLILSFLLYCLVPLLILIVIFVFRCNKIMKWLHILLTGYFFNNFLRFFTEGYLEITFAAVLNVNNMSFGTIQEASSLIIAVLVSILSLVFPFMTAALLYDNKKAIASGHEVYLKRFGTMYSEMDYERHWINTMYYPFFMLKRLIFVVSLVTLTEYPQIQINSYIFLTFLGFCYQYLAQPFKHKISNVLGTINEGSLCCIAFLQLVFIIDIKKLTIINATGWMMIGACLANIKLNFLIMVIVSKINSCD